MLSAEDKLELIRLIGQAINEQGGLMVKGEMIGEGGIQQVVNPVETRTTSVGEVFTAISEKIEAINASLPSNYEPTKEIQYVFNQSQPLHTGIWQYDSDIQLDYTPANMIYTDQTNKIFTCDYGNKKVYIYDADTMTVSDTITLENNPINIASSIDNAILAIYDNTNYINIYVLSYGTYILNQRFPSKQGCTGFVFLNATGSRLVTTRLQNYWNRIETFELGPNGLYQFVSERQEVGYDSFGSYMNLMGDELYLSVKSNTSNNTNYDNVSQFVWNKKTKNWDRKVALKRNSDKKNWWDLVFYNGGYVTPDKRRIFTSDYKKTNNYSQEGAVLILKENDSIRLSKDPFQDGSMELKYDFDDTCDNEIDAKYNMEPNHGTVTYFEGVDYGKIVKFDGTVDLKILNSTDLETQNFTYAFNIKIPSVNTDYNYIMSTAHTDMNSSARGYFIATKNNKLVFGHGSGDGEYELVTSNSDIEDNAFHHVAVTVTNGGLIHIYIDGVLDNQQLVTPSLINYQNTLSYISIGSRPAAQGAETSFGTFDMYLLKRFNRELTLSEVKAVQTLKMKQPFDYVDEQLITSPNATTNGYFGHSVAVNFDNTKLWVAAYGEKRIYLYKATEIQQ